MPNCEILHHYILIIFWCHISWEKKAEERVWSGFYWFLNSCKWSKAVMGMSSSRNQPPIHIMGWLMQLNSSSGRGLAAKNEQKANSTLILWAEKQLCYVLGEIYWCPFGMGKRGFHERFLSISILDMKSVEVKEHRGWCYFKERGCNIPI